MTTILALYLFVVSVVNGTYADIVLTTQSKQEQTLNDICMNAPDTYTFCNAQQRRKI